MLGVQISCFIIVPQALSQGVRLPVSTWSCLVSPWRQLEDESIVLLVGYVTVWKEDCWECPRLHCVLFR